MKMLKTLISAASLALASMVMFAATVPGADIVVAQASPNNTTDMTEGEVRKLDKENKKLTLKHGEIKNLDMPAMTMVFQVKDPAMLERVKPGDKVKFRVEKISGAYTVTAIETAK